MKIEELTKSIIDLISNAEEVENFAISATANDDGTVIGIDYEIGMYKPRKQPAEDGTGAVVEDVTKPIVDPLITTVPFTNPNPLVLDGVGWPVAPGPTCVDNRVDDITTYQTDKSVSQRYTEYSDSTNSTRTIDNPNIVTRIGSPYPLTDSSTAIAITNSDKNEEIEVWATSARTTKGSAK